MKTCFRHLKGRFLLKCCFINIITWKLKFITFFSSCEGSLLRKFLIADYIFTRNTPVSTIYWYFFLVHIIFCGSSPFFFLKKKTYYEEKIVWNILNGLHFVCCYWFPKCRNLINVYIRKIILTIWVYWKEMKLYLKSES